MRRSEIGEARDPKLIYGQSDVAVESSDGVTEKVLTPRTPQDTFVVRSLTSERRIGRRQAILLEGQGTQHPFMGSGFKGNREIDALYGSIKDAFGFDPREIGEEVMERTDLAQPAIVGYDLAQLIVAKQRNPRALSQAEFLAGHSLGEWAAFFVAGVFEDVRPGLELLKARAEGMQKASDMHPGGNLVVGFNQPSEEGAIGEFVRGHERVKSRLQETGLDIGIINTPRQWVFAGLRDDLEKGKSLIDGEEKRYARVLAQTHTGPFHSRFMEIAEEFVERQLEKTVILEPNTAIVLNTTARPTRDPIEIRKEFIRHLKLPVLWYDTLLFLMEAVGKTHEFGGRTDILNNMLGRIQHPNISVTKAEALKLAGAAAGAAGIVAGSVAYLRRRKK